MNSSNITYSSNILSLSVDELMDKLGYEIWIVILNQFIMPIVAFTNICICSLSTWVLIKHRSKFVDPVFFYYRLLFLFCIVCSLVIFPYLFCYSPRFIPDINTYTCSIFVQFANFLNQLLYHYCSSLEICILLTRMKVFNLFLQNHFTLSPKIVSLILFFVCLIIDLPIFFTSSVKSFGDFYYIDKNGIKHNSTFYSTTTSAFATSLLGQISVILVYLFNIFFTLIVGVTLNVVSVLQYKAYLKRREKEAAVIQTRVSNIQPSPSSKSGLKKFLVELQKILDQKERNQRKIEKNMFGMALTLCTISIFSRVIITLITVLYLISYSITIKIIVNMLSEIIYNLVPVTPIFVFYTFNGTFRQEMRKILRRNK